MSAIRLLLLRLVLAAGPLALVAVLTASAQESFMIGAKRAELAPQLTAGARIGKIRVLGMLELPSVNINGVRLVELSDLAWDEDEQVLYALSNKGALFWLRPLFTDGVLTDVAVLRAFRLYDVDNKKPLRDRRADAEGMDILYGNNGRKGDAELLVAFERFPRVVSYRTNGAAIAEHALPAPLGDIAAFRSANKAFEAVAIDPSFGIVVTPEIALKKETAGFTHLFSLTGKSWRYPLADGNSIVSMKSRDRKGLLVLERAYSPLYGRTVITLNKAVLSAASDSARVETLVSLSSNDGLALDNFEGLSAHRRNRFFMVSDNNDMFFQRTLLLYFEIVE